MSLPTDHARLAFAIVRTMSFYGAAFLRRFSEIHINDTDTSEELGIVFFNGDDFDHIASPEGSLSLGSRAGGVKELEFKALVMLFGLEFVREYPNPLMPNENFQFYRITKNKKGESHVNR